MSLDDPGTSTCHDDLAAYIDKFTSAAPQQMFSSTPSTDSIAVRRFTFALENLIAQLQKRISPQTQSLMESMAYKFTGPQRHQNFWKKFRRLFAAVKKYNSVDTLKRFNDLHKKLVASTTYFYMPSEAAIRFVASRYLSLIWRLEQIRCLAIEVADCIMGQLELGQWENLSIFIVALSSEIAYAIPDQARNIIDAYASISEFVRQFDKRFPATISDASVSFTSSLLSLREYVKGDSTYGSSRVMLLLQMTDEKLDDAKRSIEIERVRKEMIDELGIGQNSATADIGVSVERIVDTVELEPESSMESSVTLNQTASSQLLETDEAFDESGIGSEIVRESSEPSVAKKSKKNKRKNEKRKKRKALSSVDSAIGTEKEDEGEDGQGLDMTAADTTVFLDENTSEQPELKKRKKKKKRLLGVSTPESLHVSSAATMVPELLVSEAPTPVSSKKKRKQKRMLESDVSFVSVSASAVPPKKKKLKKNQQF